MKLSISEKKHRLEHAQKTFSQFGVMYIAQWTKKELKNFTDKPIVIPNGNHGFFIGMYKVSRIHETCWQVTCSYDDRLVLSFMNKTAAVLYCLLNVTKKYSLANDLLQADSNLGRVDMDLQIYKKSLKYARYSNDKVRLEVIRNRIGNAKMQYDSYSKILEKTINLAKYVNLGNTTL
jgi:hypothetical protein